MVNFEKMIPEELKDFLKSYDLKALDIKELAKLLAIVQGYKAYFAPQRGINAFVEKTYWNAVEKEISKEFQRRNCNVCVMSFADVFSEVNKFLLEGDIQLAAKIEKTISEYGSDIVVKLKEELMAEPDYQSKYGEVIKLLDSHLRALS